LGVTGVVSTNVRDDLEGVVTCIAGDSSLAGGLVIMDFTRIREGVVVVPVD